MFAIAFRLERKRLERENKISQFQVVSKLQRYNLIKKTTAQGIFFINSQFDFRSQASLISEMIVSEPQCGHRDARAMYVLHR